MKKYILIILCCLTNIKKVRITIVNKTKQPQEINVTFVAFESESKKDFMQKKLPYNSYSYSITFPI